MAKSPDPAEVKKQLEAIAGRTIEISPEQIKLFSFPVGAHDVTDGTVEWENIFGFKSCIASSLLDASGAVTTGTAGNVTFLLSNVICLPQVRSLAEPVHLVATAQTPRIRRLSTSRRLMQLWPEEPTFKSQSSLGTPRAIRRLAFWCIDAAGSCRTQSSSDRCTNLI